MFTTPEDEKAVAKGIFNHIVESTKRNQMKIIKPKNEITEIKNSVQGFNIRLDRAGKKDCKRPTGSARTEAKTQPCVLYDTFCLKGGGG